MLNRIYSVQSLTTLSIMITIISGCVSSPQLDATPTIQAERQPRPTPASTLPQLIENLSNDDPLVRVVSAYALRNYYPDDVVASIPILIENLHYDRYTEVQISAAVLLGWLGTRARQAIPDLISTMENSKIFIHVRESAANALGNMGDVSVVPALAKQLHQEDLVTNYTLEIASAKSIAILANQKFRDTGTTCCHIGNDGVPWIVSDARDWWEKVGQYVDWKIR